MEVEIVPLEAKVLLLKPKFEALKPHEMSHFTLLDQTILDHPLLHIGSN